MDLMDDEGGELAGEVSAYLRTRGYLTELSKLEDLDETEYVIAGIIDTTHARNEASSPHITLDLRAAEQQFSLFKNWTLSLPQDQTRVEFSQVLAPLLCHLYLECLPRHKHEDCLHFIRKFSGLLSSPEWCQFWEELARCSSLVDLSEFPLIRAFRECKIEIRLTFQSLQLLRRYLSRRDCRALIQVLQTWFKAVVLTDGVISSEGEDDKSVIKLEEDDTDDVVCDEKKEKEQETIQIKEENFPKVNSALEHLLTVMKNKRMTPAPPPPLLLFTAYNTNGVVSGRVSDDHKLAATGDQLSEVRVWGVDETEFKPQPITYADSVPISAGYPVSSQSNTHIDLDISNKKLMWQLRGHSSTVYDVGFVSSSDYLLSVSFDTTMRLWHLSDFSCTAVYRGHDAPIWALTVSPILNMVATASHDKTARLWSLERTFPLRIFAGHKDDVTCLAFHPNGSYLATGSSDRTVRFWSTTDGDLVRVLGGSESLGTVDALVFSPCGQYLASSGDDQFVWLWNLNASRAVCQLEGHRSRIVSLDWSLDGNSVAACTFDGDIFVWPLDALQKPEDDIVPIKYPTKCSTLLSLRYSNKNSLMAVGLSSDH